MIRNILLLGAALAVGATSVIAQEDPIAERKKIMKAQGAAAKDPGLMLKGDEKFDLAKVHASLRTFQDTSKRLPALWPDNSKTGGETEALPVIWQEKDKYLALFTKLSNDSGAALTAIKDEASFKAEFPKVLANCGSCHKVYRQPK